MVYLCTGQDAFSRLFFTLDDVRYMYTPYDVSGYEYGVDVLNVVGTLAITDDDNCILNDDKSNYAGIRNLVIPDTVDWYRHYSDDEGWEWGVSQRYPVTRIWDAALAYANSKGDEYGRIGLESISVPSSITYVGRRAFYESNIERVLISDLAAWCRIQFVLDSFNNYHESSYFSFGGLHKYATTPIGTWTYYYNIAAGKLETDSIESQGELWLNSEKIEDLVIPAEVVKVADFAFLGCEQLRSLLVSEQVEHIGQMAFAGCRGLKTVSLPSTLKRIDAEALRECAALREVYCNVANPADVALGTAVFRNVPIQQCTLVVPKGSVHLYQQSAQWCDFGSIIEEGTSSQGTINADVNGDGLVDIDDVNAVINVILHP